MALTSVQKKGRIDGLSPHQDARVIDQFMDDVIQYINCAITGGSGGNTGPVLTSELCIQRRIEESFTIPTEVTCVQRNPIFEPFVSVTINGSGEFYLL